MRKIRLTDFPYLMLGVLIIFFLCTHTANVEYDSPSYIQFWPTRPFLYPFFVWVFHWAGPYQFSGVIWAQGILLFCTMLYVRCWLKKNLQVADFLIFLVCLLVLLTISFHYQLWFIQSEGLSFPLFILSFFSLIECFQRFSLKKLLYLSLLVSMLIFTRLQFYYFYAIFFVLCIWYLWQKIPIKQVLLASLILFGSMFFTILADYCYHYVKHGTFDGAAYGGLLILSQTIFLADNQAANYFQSSEEKTLVQKMLDKRNANKLNQDADLVMTFKPAYLQYAYQSYVRNFPEMQKIIDDTLRLDVINSSEIATYSIANAMATKINKTLILHSTSKNLIFLFWKFLQCVGGIPLFLFFLILLFGTCFKIACDKIREPDLSLIFVAVIAMITFFNAAIIAVCNPDLPPYFCYSQFMFYCLCAFLMSRIHYVS